jgi:hypothetical protein
MMGNYNMEAGSPAAGGVEAPRDTVSQPVLPVYPDQIPGLSDPTQRPDEPITDGLAIGAGRGREALTNYDPRRQEAEALKRWLPIMEPVMRDPETPDSVKTLIQYIRGI